MSKLDKILNNMGKEPSINKLIYLKENKIKKSFFIESKLTDLNSKILIAEMKYLFL